MIVVLPNALEWATRKGLIERGFALSNVRGRWGNLTVARVPVLRETRRSVVESYFEFAKRPQ